MFYRLEEHRTTILHISATELSQIPILFHNRGNCIVIKAFILDKVTLSTLLSFFGSWGNLWALKASKEHDDKLDAERISFVILNAGCWTIGRPSDSSFNVINAFDNKHVPYN